jgi:hypothetical protein
MSLNKQSYNYLHHNVNYPRINLHGDKIFIAINLFCKDLRSKNFTHLFLYTGEALANFRGWLRWCVFPVLLVTHSTIIWNKGLPIVTTACLGRMKQDYISVSFRLLATAILYIAIFWIVTPCSLVGWIQLSGRTCWFHIKIFLTNMVTFIYLTTLLAAYNKIRHCSCVYYTYI